MPECDALPRCPFFHDKIVGMPAVAALVKQRYCLGHDQMHCARFLVRVALGPMRVPSDLYPDQVERAKQLIAAADEAAPVSNDWTRRRSR